MINTVLGSISANELGKTLMHEHIAFGFGGWYANYTLMPFDREKCIKASLDSMKKLQNYGVKTFVDATPNDSGRDPELLREISDKSGMNIICSTGLYSENDGGAAYFKFRAREGANISAEIFELFLKEITQGIVNTEVKAGVIKVATSGQGITQHEETVLKVAARVQSETGVPIITHTEAQSLGIEQADLLISEGADPKRIMIGHVCNSGDTKYHIDILKRGVYVAFDRLGLEFLQSDAVRKACIVNLVNSGYANKIMLSQDSLIWMLGQSLTGMNSCHVFQNVIPDLLNSGVTDEQINTMMIENPRKLFTGE